MSKPTAHRTRERRGTDKKPRSRATGAIRNVGWIAAPAKENVFFVNPSHHESSLFAVGSPKPCRAFKMLERQRDTRRRLRRPPPTAALACEVCRTTGASTKRHRFRQLRSREVKHDGVKII
ncbi:hypothetical protein BHM03_00057488 [Ensete ventricosum]|nr:hypothetical protein BHM03_00057488 [Ensete ventricosum]